MPPPRRLNRAAGLPGGRKKRPAAAPQAKCCDDPQIEDRDGAKICTNCFTQISEANIVADVTFEENANGSATVQGGFLGENARHVSSLNSTAFRRMGGGERNNIEEIQRKGQDQLNVFRGRNLLAGNVFEQAMQIWGIAARNNFTAGRSLEEVVAACAYAALRRQPDNTVLLIDIAEIIKINVFRLGDVYKTMCRQLYLANEHVGYQHMVDVESLIMKYCDKLEFHEATRQVAEDALKIVRRMKRDWMVTGRHPAGLCGACIILAARMNNFKRTVREVVYVSKIADATISKRIEEFRRTKSAALTVSQFRKYATRLSHQHDPPSIFEGQQRLEKLEKKKRKRQAALNEHGALSLDGAINIDDQSDVESSSGTPAPETSQSNDERRKRARRTSQQPEQVDQQPPRFDADGFAIPALPKRSIPIDPAIIPVLPETDAPRKRGRPRKSAAPPPVEISEGELLLEEELQEQIQEALNDDEVNALREQLLMEKEQAKSQETAKTAREIEAQNTQARRAAAGITWHNSDIYSDLDEVTALMLEEEFKDDAEVENCILSEQQAREKEKIWLYHNEDWLRDQYEKELAKKIAASAPPKQKKSRGGKKKGKKGEDANAAGTPAETPADAAASMLADKAGPQFSRYVNYEQLGKIYNHDKPRTASRAGSEAPSVSQAGGDSRAGTPASDSRASPVDEAPPTPAATQSQAQDQDAANARKPTASPAPPTPDATQAQDTQAGAEQVEEVPEEEDVDDEEPEEAQDDDDDDNEYNRFRYPGGDDDGDAEEFGGGDDYEGGGYDDDDDYEAALNPTHGASLEGTF